MEPLLLGPNQPERFYRGGAAIARFRRLTPAGDRHPEDWVGSTTTIFGESEAGLSRLPDTTLLRDRVAADPAAWLGPAHVERLGPSPALLVKLLDAAERLPVHCHPDDGFARSHLGCPCGKTEAWVIVEARGEAACVHLGFRQDVEAATVAGWVERQESRPLLEALHRVRVRPGDAVLVPAGVPHAIGEGILLVELQQPSDLSVLLEWTGFDVDGRRDGHLGLGFGAALGCLDRSGWCGERLAGLRRTPAQARPLAPGVSLALPPLADPFFRAERLSPQPETRLDPSFAVLVVLAGEGTLSSPAGDPLPVRRGDTVVVPFAAGETVLRGPVEALRCLPPGVA